MPKILVKRTNHDCFSFEELEEGKKYYVNAESFVVDITKTQLVFFKKVLKDYQLLQNSLNLFHVKHLQDNYNF